MLNTVQKKTMFDKDVFETFVKPGEIVEVRILNARGKSSAWGNDWANGIVSGYFDNHDAFCRCVREAEKAKHSGIYFTLQVIDRRLLARANNRLKPSVQATTDKDVIAYKWLPIDIDPIRPAGIPSSDSELQRAMDLREQVAEWMMENFGSPATIKAMSGNGAHLLFRFPDMPANATTNLSIKNTLLGLAKQFPGDQVKIDTEVFNPSRIWKLYGTTARKGDELPAREGQEGRPHRLSYIDWMKGGVDGSN
jgi:hypothetical protein